MDARQVKGKYSPNLNDLEFIKCPLCDKDIVKDRWHGCKPLLHSEEYVNVAKGIRLLWHPAHGWHSLKFSAGKVIEKLSFADVFNWVMNDKEFISIGSWKNPKEIKNIY